MVSLTFYGGANEVGMKTGLAKYGLWNRNDSIKEDYEIERFEELLKVIENHE